MTSNFRQTFTRELLRVSPRNFTEQALQLFRYQAINNPIYAQYLHALDTNIAEVQHITQIPFLPIELYKYHTIKTGTFDSKIIFESSGTSQQTRSKQHLAETNLYETVSVQIFEQLYGNIENYTFLALLPSYLERSTSSLVYMVNHFIGKSKQQHSGFYLYNFNDLAKKLRFLQKNTQQKVILWGVTFALLDFVQQYPIKYPNLIVMETGGMKGRGKERTRAEVQQILQQGLGTAHIHSEYGMTELSSQAYAKHAGRFKMSSFLQVCIRDLYDPFNFLPTGASGGINLIDLANVDTCAFIETKDIGKLHPDNTFEVLGRFDNADIRGCNLLVL